MRLVRLYSNKPELFAPVAFNDGLSAVIAEIRLPENRGIDTHNLGKTTLGALIDFCLLKGKDPDFFLYRHHQFAEFTFSLELELPGPEFLTIRRKVLPGSKVDFLRQKTSIQDASEMPDDDWDHLNMPFNRAKTFLDGILNFAVLRPWGFRNLIGYLIRTQQDYQDVFQLKKFSGKHREWKPFVAHLLGVESGAVEDLYDKKDELEVATNELTVITREWGGGETDPSVVDGLISVKRREVEQREATLNALNFGEDDQRTIGELVDQLDERIVLLNDELYRQRQLHRRISESLEQRKIVFNPEAAGRLFAEAGVAFEGQIKKEFSQLVEFNAAITEERQAALIAQREESETAIHHIERELKALNARRAQSLEYIRETDTIEKYKTTSRELTRLQAELAVLEQRRDAATALLERRRQVRALRQEYDDLQSRVEDEIAALSQDDASRFGLIRRYFAEIVAQVIDEQAILAMTLNNSGGVDFHAELVDKSGIATSGDRGTSYRKLLCIAFDLALLRAYLDVPFPRFVYHDGALEQLEPRKRQNLIEVFREYAAVGEQPIISLLDSDLPAPLGSSDGTLVEDDVVLTLHDEGPEGRLFRMPEW